MLNRGTYVFIHKHLYCVIWKKNRRDDLLNGVEELEGNFKYVKNKTNENNLSQRISYRFPKHETINQLENVFVFDLETYEDQEFAEAFAAGLFDVNGLQDRWDRDLTPDEIEIENEYAIVFDKSCGNAVMNMLNFISENYGGDERTYIHKDGDEGVSS